MKHSHKVKVVGRRIDLLHTDVGATFRRVRREMEAAERERTAKVRDIKTKREKA